MPHSEGSITPVDFLFIGRHKAEKDLCWAFFSADCYCRLRLTDDESRVVKLPAVARPCTVCARRSLQISIDPSTTPIYFTAQLKFLWRHNTKELVGTYVIHPVLRVPGSFPLFSHPDFLWVVEKRGERPALSSGRQERGGKVLESRRSFSVDRIVRAGALRGALEERGVNYSQLRVCPKKTQL